MVKYNKNKNLENILINECSWFFWLNKIITHYEKFLAFFFFNFLTVNSFSFFKKIFLNLQYLSIILTNSNQKSYLYKYITYKKQNSLLKKKFNYTHNLHPIFYRKNLKKKYMANSDNTVNLNVFKSQNKLFFFNRHVNSLNFLNILNGKKKLKKTILMNRKLYNFIFNNNFKSAKKISDNIRIYSKLKTNNILLNLELSLLNILNCTNLIKSSNDALKLIRLRKIFINRKIVSNPLKTLKQGDIIEFILKYKFISYIKFFKFSLSKHLLKIKNKIWYKLRLLDKNKLSYNKNNTLNFIFKTNSIFKENIPNYLEIDYFTLSIILLTHSFNIENYNLNIKKIISIYMFKLYNWK